jgi:hypothetical protein
MRRLRAGMLAVVSLSGLLTAGCGIRDTSVPVDAGAAPSRASCAPPQSGRSSQVAGRISVRIYLVCTSEVSSVVRSVRLAEDKARTAEPLLMARELLDQLQQIPGEAEAEAGFTTGVRSPVRVFSPAKGDPAGAVRLSMPVGELPQYALAQLVCTYADTTVAVGGRVLIGGPDRATDPLRRYECTEQLRRRPETAVTSGVPLH